MLGHGLSIVYADVQLYMLGCYVYQEYPTRKLIANVYTSLSGSMIV